MTRQGGAKAGAGKIDARKVEARKVDAGKVDRAIARLVRHVAKRRWVELDAECDRLLESFGDEPHILFLKAVAAYGQFRLGTAAGLAEAAHAGLPHSQDITGFLAVIYALGGDLNTSAYYAKLHGTGQPEPRLAGAVPADFPNFNAAFLNVQERRLFTLASRELAAGRWREAEVLYREHLQFLPRDVQAATGLATSLILQNEWQPAIDALRGFRHQFPRDAIIAATLANALEQWGRPLEAEACYHAATMLAPDNAGIAAAWLNAPQAYPRPLADALKDWGRRFAAAAVLPRLHFAEAKERLTVLWVLGAQSSAAERQALAHALAAFDPTRVRMIGAGPLPLAHDYNAPFQAAFDHWVDIHAMDVLTIQTVLAAQQADVIMDVAGMTSPDTVLALGMRLAPVQLAWPSLPHLPHDGYSGRVGDRWIEHDPVADGLPVYTLEHGSAFILRPEAATPAERRDGPPCFGLDADFLHLHPRQVRQWAEILEAVPESVLLLRDHGFRLASNAQRLLEIFGDHGLGGRVDVFSEASLDVFTHQIDVLLQPAPRGSLEVAVQALAAGVPIVVTAESLRSNNQTQSLLHHLGLAEACVAVDERDAIAKAVAWAGDPLRRQAFAEQAREALAGPVFDAAARGADLRALIARAWADVVSQGEPAIQGMP